MKDIRNIDPERCSHVAELKWSIWGTRYDSNGVGKIANYLLCQYCRGYYLVLEPDGTYHFEKSPWHPDNVTK